MIPYLSLAPLNAILNAVAAVLLVAGFVCVRYRRVRWHRACMIAAVVVSAGFMTSYLTYHYHVGNVMFAGEGWVRPVYFAILIPHIVLAAVIVPMVFMTLYRAFRGRFAGHRRIARWTLPLWIYVSVTGVLVYLMLYRIYGPPRYAPGVVAASAVPSISATASGGP